MTTSTARGTVEEILVAFAKGAPMDSLPEVDVQARSGLRGHHHRNITLIEAEKLAAFARAYDVLFTAHDARRNIVTRHIDLNALLGRKFRVGSALLFAEELCEPCRLLARRTCRQVLHGLVHRGGLRCRILQGGFVRVGDPVGPDPAEEF